MALATSAARAPHAYTHLLARYIAGQMEEAQVNGLSDLLDASDASTEERLAFTGFFLDAADATQPLPSAEELADFLAIARA